MIDFDLTVGNELDRAGYLFYVFELFFRALVQLKAFSDAQTGHFTVLCIALDSDKTASAIRRVLCESSP